MYLKLGCDKQVRDTHCVPIGTPWCSYRGELCSELITAVLPDVVITCHAEISTLGGRYNDLVIAMGVGTPPLRNPLEMPTP